MKGGYTLIDCTGLDLTAESTKTISGLYNKVKAAIDTGKMIIVANMIWGSGKPVTPVPVFAVDFGNDGIYCTVSTRQIQISKLDVVTIVDLAPESDDSET